jgi:trehalose 6-phosphate synthase/phosphatase
MARTLILTQRLPVTARVRDGSLRLRLSGGGVTTALREFHERNDSVWIAASNDRGAHAAAQRERSADDTVAERQRFKAILARHRLVEVPLTSGQDAACRTGFAASVLWPLFHYQLDHAPIESRDWDTYRAVNMRFADAAAECYQTGDRIWVHDHHLMLVPDLVRQLVPHARIGFFLHTPFPSYEVFRTLPCRADLLTGLLGADLIGFHTFPYVRRAGCARHPRHRIGGLPHSDARSRDPGRRLSAWCRCRTVRGARRTPARRRGAAGHS